MKIYTKKGDSGHTSLIDGQIVNKHNLYVDAYGTVDELNSFLGLLKDYIKDETIKDILNNIQVNPFNEVPWADLKWVDQDISANNKPGPTINPHSSPTVLKI